MSEVQTMNTADGHDENHHLIRSLEEVHRQNGSIGEAIPNATVDQIGIQTYLEQFQDVVMCSPMNKAISRDMFGGVLEAESSGPFGGFDILESALGGA